MIVGYRIKHSRIFPFKSINFISVYNYHKTFKINLLYSLVKFGKSPSLIGIWHVKHKTEKKT